MSARDLVVDASVAAKWVLTEVDTARANEVLLCEGRIFAPRVLVLEMGSAISRAVRMGRIGRPEAEEAFLEATKLVDDSALTLVEDAALLPRAQTLALDLRHPLIDCLYLALAEREGARLVTADRTFLARAASLSSLVVSLADV